MAFCRVHLDSTPHFTLIFLGISFKQRIFNIMKISTIAFLVTPTQVVLAPKLKGWGVGYLNGYGGKVEASDHSLVVAAIRELLEESTVAVDPADIVLITTIDFYRLDQHIFQCPIFLATSWKGEPKATDEMGAPEYFSRKNPPTERMWKGDALWIKQVLKGRIISDGGFVRYDEKMKNVVEWYLPSSV